MANSLMETGVARHAGRMDWRGLFKLWAAVVAVIIFSL